jgi:hypothetical protein
MFECCQLIEHKFPTQAKRWLKVSVEYDQNKINADELKKARCEAWAFLGDEYLRIDLPHVASVRAVISLLYPDNIESEEDWFMTIDCFVDFCNFVENHQNEQVEIFRKIFSKYLD